MKVLLADDEIVVRTLLQRTLERIGLEVICAGDGMDAAEQLLDPNGPRIAILDWMMPRMDGPAVCRRVRGQAGNAYRYLILLTARERREDVLTGFEAGADDYLIKPWNPEEIKARVRAGQRIVELQDKLTHDAEHDALTGLPNRAFFTKRLSESISRAESNETRRFTVLFVDIDRFKTINDSLGHMLGDEVMKQVARRIQQSVRQERTARTLTDRRLFSPPEDVVARLGGDEFVVLLEDFADVNDGVRVAKHIQADLEAPFHIGDHELFVTASIGISTSNRNSAHTSDILRSADSAMYMAKVLGKDRYEIKDPSEPNAAPHRLRIEHDLRKALQHNEFVVHYQPIVQLSDCRITSFEALIRWQHQTRGLVFPGDFLPIADEIGLTPQIGSWVLKEACRQTYMWNNAVPDVDPVTICVNLMAKQFDPYRLFAEVKQVIQETGIDPRTLELEVTETLTMQHALHADEIFRGLSTLGVTFSLDDFGTGYSSLTYLQRFPVRKLKIDRSFISGIDRSPESFAIVETIVKLGHILGMKVVGEGIETLEQMNILRGLGCDLGQGYLFSRSVDADRVLPMIIDRKMGKTLKANRGASEFRFKSTLPKASITSRA